MKTAYLISVTEMLMSERKKFSSNLVSKNLVKNQCVLWKNLIQDKIHKVTSDSSILCPLVPFAKR